MHGTWRHEESIGVDGPTQLRPDDELTFGLPVYRHSTNFEPVRLTVEQIQFREAYVPPVDFIG